MWIVTKDHICDGEYVGKHSHNYTEEKFKTHDKTKVKLYDDDGNLYLEGLVSTKDINGYEEVAFAMLNRFMYDLGVTYMEYEEDGEWKVL